MIYRSRNKQAGLGLIDILIGIFIGLIVVLTTYGSLIFYQNIQRSSISRNSSVENGITGVYAIQRDIVAAGLGFLTSGTIGCSVLNAAYGSTTIATNASIAPVSITSGSGDPDSITVLSSSSILAAAPSTSTTAFSTSSATIKIFYGDSLQAGQLAIISSSNTNLPCTIVQITSVPTNTGSKDVLFDAGGSPATSYPINSWIANIGGLNWNTWSINNGSLQRLDRITGTTVTIADNIVQMKAQYGISSGGASTNIQQWVDATGSYASLDSTTIGTIRAVRIAIVARSPQREKPSSGGTCTTTTQAPQAWPGTTLSLAADPNWMCYRYKLFKTVVPIQNILMGGIS